MLDLRKARDVKFSTRVNFGELGKNNPQIFNEVGFGFILPIPPQSQPLLYVKKFLIFI